MQRSFTIFPTPATFLRPFNSTILDFVIPTSVHPPIYYVNRPSLLSSISDKYLTLAVPIIIYWVFSLGFHALDTAKIPYFEARRLHESPEVLSRNKATVLQVIKAVFWQQVVQIILALVCLEDDATVTTKGDYGGHLGEMERIAPWVVDVTLVVLGRRSGEDLLQSHGEAMVRWVYWWGIPAAQMLFAL